MRGLLFAWVVVFLWWNFVYDPRPKCVSSAYENGDGFGSHVQTMFQVVGEAWKRRVPYCLSFPRAMEHTNRTAELYALTGFVFNDRESCLKCRHQYIRDFGMKIPAKDFFTRDMIRRFQDTYVGLSGTPRMFATPNHTHVVVHFRVRNAVDNRDQRWDFSALRDVMNDVRSRYPRPLFHVVTQTPVDGRRMWMRLMNECRRYRDCVLELDGDVVETYDAMVRAPVLVTANSAFSYTAAWFNKNGDVYYLPYHQGPFPWWRFVGGAGA